MRSSCFLNKKYNYDSHSLHDSCKVGRFDRKKILRYNSHQENCSKTRLFLTAQQVSSICKILHNNTYLFHFFALKYLFVFSEKIKSLFKNNKENYQIWRDREIYPLSQTGYKHRKKFGARSGGRYIAGKTQNKIADYCISGISAIYIPITRQIQKILPLEFWFRTTIHKNLLFLRYVSRDGP